MKSPVPTSYHELQTEAVTYHKFRLERALDGIVDYCWSIRNTAQEPQSTPDIHIPDGMMEVVFILEGTYEKKEVGTASSQTKQVVESCVIGLQTESHFVKGLGMMWMLGIKFTPFGFARLFGHRVYASKNEQVALPDFGAKWLCELQDRLAELTCIASISQAISAALLQALRSGEAPDSLKFSADCLTTILSRKGCLSVEELSARHYKSVRQIQRYFREHFDASPKEFINITRFKNLYQESIVRNHLPHQFLDYGYFDQAHFIHDFRRRTGVAPSQAIQADFLMKNRIAAVNLGH
ncbi:MAG: DUF6597 domain-containing transcriptional factor [Saprospiraceae bacterium]